MHSGNRRGDLGEARVAPPLVLKAFVENEDVVRLASPLTHQAGPCSQRLRSSNYLLSPPEPCGGKIDAFANGVRQVTMDAGLKLPSDTSTKKVGAYLRCRPAPALTP